jgi:hypothetical protein
MKKGPSHYGGYGRPGRPTSVMAMPIGVCRFGSCMKPGKGKPPLCPDHTPPEPDATIIPWKPRKEDLMAGSFRVAKTRRAS